MTYRRIAILCALFLLALSSCSTTGGEDPTLVAPEPTTPATAALSTEPPPATAPSPPAETSPTVIAASPAAAPDVEVRIDALLAEMTLAEKIGQMTQVEKNSLKPADVTKYAIGSVLSGGGGYPRPNTPEAWAEMVGGFQDAALQTRLGIPLIYGVDAIHGVAGVDGATVFPQPVGLGATGDADLVQRAAQATAAEAAAMGIRWNFAPIVAVVQDIRWGRTYEAFGEDTGLVSELSAAYVSGLQAGEGGDGSPIAMLATPKHFIGDGATEWGTSTNSFNGRPYQLDQGDMQLDEATVREMLVPPYAATIEAGAMSVMASFNSWQGEKVHGRADLLTGLLKDELGFTGFIISDWAGCDQIDLNNTYAAIVRCVNAGVDMNMVPYDYKAFIDTLTTAVENGDVPIERIDDAVRRILRAKFALGLFDEPATAPGLEVVSSAEHRELAREAVRKSLVLLQNENGALPIRREQTPLIYVAGEGADDAGIQAGGWTIEWQGEAGLDLAGATTILEGIEAAAGEGTRVEYNRDGKFGGNDRAAVGIVVLAEVPYAEGVGDREDLSLTSEQVALLERVRERSETVVVVLLSGRPLVITEQLPLADAWVAAWLPGSEGQGVADVLFGDYPFTGTLPYSWPRSNDQLPLSVLLADPAGPLFPRGYGLTMEP